MKELIERKFWERTKVLDGCWEWTGSKLKDSRGVLSIGRKNETAPRVSWFLHHGNWPDAGVFVCHSCDNPNCVNPKHLWLGDVKSNAKDAANKGRLHIQRHPEESYFATEEGKTNKARNENHGMAKLTNEQVKEIKDAIANSTSTKGLFAFLANKFKVCNDTIVKIASGKTWKTI